MLQRAPNFGGFDKLPKLKKMDMRFIWDSSGSGKEPVEDFCEYSDAPSDSVKCWEILE
jgi:hypothetical protein